MPSEMQEGINIELPQGNLHIGVFGNGSEKVLAFHGIIRSSDQWSFVSQKLRERFTWFCVDLPFHGKSIPWREGAMSHEETAQIFNALLQKMEVGPTESIIVAGYSIGGRFALEFARHFPERVKGLLLIAPDGLITNPWMRFSTGAGRGLFRRLMLKPDALNSFVHRLIRLKVLPASYGTLGNWYLQSEDLRLLIWRSWTAFRPIGSLNDLKKLPPTTRIWAMFGVKDMLIPSKTARCLKSTNATVKIVDQGHILLHSGSNYQLEAWLMGDEEQVRS